MTRIRLPSVSRNERVMFESRLSIARIYRAAVPNLGLRSINFQTLRSLALAANLFSFFFFLQSTSRPRVRIHVRSASRKHRSSK